MKKNLIMGAMLLVAAASFAADKVYDLSKKANWAENTVQVGKDAKSLTVKSVAIISAKAMIPVDGKHTYTFSGTVAAPAGKVGGTTLAGYHLYDKNKRPINQVNTQFVVKSGTVLAEAAKKGSKTIKIKANAAWKPMGHYWVAFNYKDGKVCRDISPSNIKAVKKEGDNMVVTLGAALRKDYPAGTKVRIHTSGSYFYSSIVAVKNKDANFSRTINQNQFWVETAYVRPIILVNWLLKKGTDSKKVETVYKNLKVTVKEIK